MSNLAAITGARGWLGGCVTRFFQEEGWETRGLVRAPSAEYERRFILGEEPEAGALEGVEALVHAAYDFQARGRGEIERVNVEGTEKLFRAAAKAGVARLIYISTMSAFPGCRSLYGQAKLAAEKLAAAHGALIVRPGLITGEGAGGMVGSLVGQVRGARFLPLIAGEAVLYTVHERDLAEMIFRYGAGDTRAPSRPVIAAHPEPWTFRRILEEVARREGRRPVLLPVPWRAVWLALRGAEAVGLKPSFRSDSVVSLANQDPRPDFSVPEGIEFRPRALALS